ncbi:hypothetical protein GF366_01640 [Candidatus Peregrinibacteria bacterium]|nr:hypothetical protein [Candidatus Peregrinibacteria bacterium]
MNILKSASKVVLLLFALAIVLAFCYTVFRNASNKELVMAVTSIFSASIGSVMTYYFARRSNKKQDEN